MSAVARDEVFISYSHKDKDWLERLQTMLKPLIRKGAISVWDDSKMKAGAKWRQEIENALVSSRVAVLLVSSDFLGSDFIAEHELPPLLDAAQKDGLAILWICLRKCLYKETAIEKYQAAHDISQPLAGLASKAKQDEVLEQICQKIKDAANLGFAQLSLESPIINRLNILVSPSAAADCKNLLIQIEDAVSFVASEATNHPLMFASTFSSLPLVYGEAVLLLSWDKKNAKIERVLTRDKAYPLNDLWTSVLGLYRRATLLSYRTQGHERLFLSTETKSAIALFTQLVDKAGEYLRQYEQFGAPGDPSAYSLTALLEEAEFSLANNAIGNMVARLEAVLSTVHKLILRYVPQSPGVQHPVSSPPQRKPEPSGKKSILIVEDEQAQAIAIQESLKMRGFECSVAFCASLDSHARDSP